MTATVEAPEKTEAPARKAQLPAIAAPRLPYHPLIEERFGIDKASWKALVEAVFPNASSLDSVIMVLSYCRARKLDPFKRVVHIVPIWNKDLGRMIDTVWPGIGELRTTAFRTGEYAGRGETKFGPDITQKVGSVELTFPEWAQTTVFRLIKGQRVEFAGPRVYWLETYATVSRKDDSPNDMWRTRPRGQLDKCAEAAALRAAFPEEIGSEYIPEEVQSRTQVVDSTITKPTSIDDLAAEMEETPRIESVPEGIAPDGEIPEWNAHEIETRFAKCKTEEEVTALANELVELYQDRLPDISGMEAEKKALLAADKPAKKKSDGRLPLNP
jgi:phage recombination protein Bet